MTSPWVLLHPGTLLCLRAALPDEAPPSVRDSRVYKAIVCLMQLSYKNETFALSSVVKILCYYWHGRRTILSAQRLQTGLILAVIHLPAILKGDTRRMGTRTSSTRLRLYLIIVLAILVCMGVTAGNTFVRIPSSPDTVPIASGQQVTPKTAVINPLPPASDGRTARLSPYQGFHQIDLTKMGVKGLQAPPAGSEGLPPQPLNGGAVGTGLAYMDIEPSVIPSGGNVVIVSFWLDRRRNRHSNGKRVVISRYGLP